MPSEPVGDSVNVYIHTYTEIPMRELVKPHGETVYSKYLQIPCDL
jgi:hypothetical protein